MWLLKLINLLGLFLVLLAGLRLRSDALNLATAIWQSLMELETDHIIKSAKCTLNPAD